jgi:hypothetical protein
MINFELPHDCVLSHQFRDSRVEYAQDPTVEHRKHHRVNSIALFVYCLIVYDIPKREIYTRSTVVEGFPRNLFLIR